MAKGGQVQESTVTQVQDLPEYAKPYFENLMSRAEGLTTSDYTPYTGARLSEMDPMQQQAYGMLQDTAGRGIAGLPTAQNVAQSNILAGQALAGGRTPSQFSQYGFSPAGQFTDPGVAQSYMSPYLQNALAPQIQELQRQYDIQQGGRDASAVQAGAFGGSRRFVQDALAQEATNRQMQDVLGSGYQTAYEQGAGQFGADRAARLAAQQAQAGELGRVETGTAAERQAAMQDQLAALGFSGAQAGQLAGYGQDQRTADIQSAQLLESAGKAMRASEQAGLDIGYADYLRQMGYPMEQLQQMSSILQGVPIAPNQTQTSYTPYNPLQEALGAGITGVGLIKGLG